MISLLSATYLLGAIAITAPILLHMLRRRPREVQTFPSFRFLERAMVRRRQFNNLRRLLVLLMRCAFLLLLALAFSWPFLPKFAEEPEELTVLLWDHSFSMGADPYRQDMQRRAEQFVQTASWENPVAVGLVGLGVRWSGDLTHDGPALQQFLDEHGVGNGTSRLDRALRLADHKLHAAPGKRRRIIVLTDRQLVPWQDIRLNRVLKAGTQLEVLAPVSPGFDNVAVIEAKVVGTLTSAGQELRLRTRLRNFQTRALTGVLITEWAGREVDRRSIELDPMGQATVHVTLPTERLEPHFGRVSLQVNDELKIDNEAWFIANPMTPPTVHLSEHRQSSVDFVRIALAPNPKQPAAQIKDLAAEVTVEGLTESGVMIVRDGPTTDSQLAGRLDQAMNEGATVVAVWRNTSATRDWLLRYGVAAATAPQPGTRRLGAIDFDHPVMEPFLDVRTAGLFSILFFDPPEITVPDHARVVLSYDHGHPAMAEIPVGKGRLIVLATEMSRDATDWPVAPSFLPVLRELMAYAVEHNAALDDVAVSGHPLPLGEIERVQNMATGETVALQRGAFVPRQPGAYLIDAAGGPRAIAVNVPTEESDPLQLADDYPYQRLVSLDALEPDEKKVAAEIPEDERSYWWIVLVAAMGFLMLELLLSNRTAI